MLASIQHWYFNRTRLDAAQVRTFSTRASISKRTLLLSVMLPGAESAELLRVHRKEAEYVGDLKKAIITEFKKRFASIDPDEVQLYIEDADRRLLDPMQTLRDAGIHDGTTLVADLAAAHVRVAPAGAWR